MKSHNFPKYYTDKVRKRLRRQQDACALLTVSFPAITTCSENVSQYHR